MLAKARARKPIEEKIAEAILATVLGGISVTFSPVAGIAGFIVAAGAAHHLFRKSDFNREVKRLQKRGYVALTKTEKGLLVKILKKGRIRNRQIQIEKLQLPRPEAWDRKWRLFIFDIPEKYRYARDAMRKKMKSLGLYNIQRSVLAYPYDCRRELEMIAEYYRLNEYGTYIETSYIDINKELRRHFKV